MPTGSAARTIRLHGRAAVTPAIHFVPREFRPVEAHLLTPLLGRLPEGAPACSRFQVFVLSRRDQHGDSLSAPGDVHGLSVLGFTNQSRQCVSSLGDGYLGHDFTSMMAITTWPFYRNLGNKSVSPGVRTPPPPTTAATAGRAPQSLLQSPRIVRRIYIHERSRLAAAPLEARPCPGRRAGRRQAPAGPPPRAHGESRLRPAARGGARATGRGRGEEQRHREKLDAAEVRSSMMRRGRERSRRGGGRRADAGRDGTLRPAAPVVQERGTQSGWTAPDSASRASRTESAVPISFRGERVPQSGHSNSRGGRRSRQPSTSSRVSSGQSKLTCSRHSLVACQKALPPAPDSRCSYSRGETSTATRFPRRVMCTASPFSASRISRVSVFRAWAMDTSGTISHP